MIVSLKASLHYLGFTQKLASIKTKRRQYCKYVGWYHLRKQEWNLNFNTTDLRYGKLFYVETKAPASSNI